MSGNFAIQGGGEGVGPLMANAILNFHFDFPHTSLRMKFALGLCPCLLHSELHSLESPLKPYQLGSVA